ncbi:MAG: hypothetical protein M3Y57_20535 [Acidobacteriota bacterium]|nr:hypothetical protein [Acidobacteriota bacterium]
MHSYVALVLLSLSLPGLQQATKADPLTFSLTGIEVPGAFRVAAGGINNRGQIVGNFIATTGQQYQPIFLDTNGVVSTIDIPGAEFPIAAGINDFGQIVGTYVMGNAVDGFLYNNGVITPIDILGSPSVMLNGINNAD